VDHKHRDAVPATMKRKDRPGDCSDVCPRRRRLPISFVALGSVTRATAAPTRRKCV
jgi:hypothetical protein